MKNNNYSKNSDNNSYMISISNMVICMSNNLLELIGFSENEVVNKNISEVFTQLLRIKQETFEQIDKKDNTSCYIFTKALVAIEVIISHTMGSNANERIYSIHENANSRLDDKMIFVEQIFNDNIKGVAIYSVPELILLKANQKYLDACDSPYNKMENSIGRPISEFVSGFAGSQAEVIWNEIVEKQKVNYRKELINDRSNTGISYWDAVQTPIFEKGKIKYIYEVTEDITESKLASETLHRSEMQLRLASKGATLGTYTYNFLTGEEYWSPELKSLWGLKQNADVLLDADLLYTNFHHDDRQAFLSAMNAANDPLGDGVLDVDYRIVCPDGSERWLHVQGQSEFIGEGADRHPSLASGAVIDITERKKMEMEIKSQNELLESVIENIPDPFGVYDKTGSLLQMNAAGRKLYKHDTGINVQVIHAEFVCFDLQGNKIPHENLPTRRALRGETVRNDVFVIKRPESERIIECNATPIFDNNKNIVTVIVGHRDITELKNREQNEFIHKQKEQLHQIELQKEKNIALEKVIEMKDEFLSIISHEFKTPLAVINSSLQLIEMMCKDSLSDRAKRYLDYIGENSNRLLKLVNNLLDITRANAGHLKINQSNLDIVLLTKSITESIATYAIQKSIMLSFSSTLSQKVIGIDEEKYERILLNLLSNAIKFTPTGKSINVQISQSIFKGKCKICIQVKDQGIGIPDDKKDLIFERFGQVNSSLTRQAEGTGIGLSLVKILVELQGGEIMLESKEGMGSTFTVLLPVTKVDESTMEPMLIDLADNRLIQATAIEFSDVFM